MTTIKDIANRLGISVSAVSKGLNGAPDISEELRTIVLETAVEMGYSTKRSRKEEHRRLAVFIENMDYESPSDFGYDIILGFKQSAFKQKWAVDVIPVTPAMQLEEKYDTYMLKHGYSGSFVLGFTLHHEWIKQFATTNTPTVLFDNFVSKNQNVAYIGTDNKEGIDLAIEHLVKLGHKRIALLNGTLYSMVSEQRQDAYNSGLIKYGLTPDEKLTAYGYFMASATKDHVKSFIDNGATAILCCSDVIAASVVDECKQLNLSVPGNISVVGFDNTPIASEYGLTTISQNRIELGKSSYVTLTALISRIGISSTLMRPTLVVRNSTSVCKDS